jgi:uncharacterized membrane protein YdjX (TVP38/TMEM64 family)
MLKRILTIIIFIIIIVIGFVEKDSLLNLIQKGGSLSIVISMLFVAICVFFPIIPFPVLAGTIGAVFGTTQGLFISLTGSMIGTMGFFFLSRYGFRDFAQDKLRKYPKVQEYEQVLKRNSFIAILTCRLIPVIPAPVVNMVCGLSEVKWIIFFIASAIGKIPNVLLLSYAGASFTNNKLYSIGLYVSYLVIVLLINLIIVYRKMKKN